MKTVQRFLKRVKNILFLFLVNKLCLTPLQLPDSSVHGISEARIQKWIAISFSRGSSQPKDRTHVSYSSCIGREILYHWATWETSNSTSGYFSRENKNINLRRHMNAYAGLPMWLSGKETACLYKRYRRHEFDPWAGKIFWRREWQPAPVFLPGEFHGQRSLASYSLWGCNESDIFVYACMHMYSYVRWNIIYNSKDIDTT